MDGYDHDQYDPDGDVRRFLDFSEPPPLLLPPPPPAPIDTGLAINEEILVPGQENVSFWNFDIIGSLGMLAIQDGNPGTSSNPNRASVQPTFVSIQPGQLDCNRCHVLREIVHFSGMQQVKFAVHGALGIFKHAIFHLESVREGDQPVRELLYIDLGNQNFEWVKNLLTQYVMLLKANGCIVVQDTVSSFFDALCGGIGLGVGSTSASGMVVGSTTSASGASSLPLEPELGKLDKGDSSQKSGKQSQSGVSSQSSAKETNGDTDTNVATSQITETDGSGGPIRPKKTGIAAQRERTSNMKLEDLMDYFHLTIKRASQELGLCSTSLKSICRKYGLPRWPSRKIRSIDSQIKNLESQLEGQRGGVGILALRSEIERLKERRAKFYAGLTTSI